VGSCPPPGKLAWRGWPPQSVEISGKERNSSYCIHVLSNSFLLLCKTRNRKKQHYKQGEGGGGVRGGVEKKEDEELKEQINTKVSTKFQINPSTND
jgi:hypothetical protein